MNMNAKAAKHNKTKKYPMRLAVVNDPDAQVHNVLIVENIELFLFVTVRLVWLSSLLLLFSCLMASSSSLCLCASEEQLNLERDWVTHSAVLFAVS